MGDRQSLQKSLDNIEGETEALVSLRDVLMESSSYISVGAAATKVRNDGTLVIKSSDGGPDLELNTLRFACTSGEYRPSNSYGGAIIYGVIGAGGELEQNINGRNFKTGYVTIVDTSSDAFIRSRATEGMVHGKVFDATFGISKGEFETQGKTIVGEGFAVRDGELKFNSWGFNAGTTYHTRSKGMSDHNWSLISSVAKGWTTGSVRPGTTFSVEFGLDDLFWAKPGDS